MALVGNGKFAAAGKVLAAAVALSAVLLPAFAAAADDVYETGCYVLAKGADGAIHEILDSTKVLEPTRASPRFSIALPQGYAGASVLCQRTDIVPADWKVLAAGYPLFISVTKLDEPSRLGILEVLDGHVQFQLKDGLPPTPDQIDRIQQRLNQLQDAFQSAGVTSAPRR